MTGNSAGIGRGEELAARFRFHLGRAVIVFGINLLPHSRAKLELTDMLELWTAHVRAAIASARQPQQAKD